jgi:hypothetical protein
MENATGALPTGCPVPSSTFAISVDAPDVDPELLDTTLGVAVTVILAAVNAVTPTVKVSTNDVFKGSSTCTLATPALVCCNTALATPPATATVCVVVPDPQVPIEVVNLTFVDGAGAETVTVKLSPNCIGTEVGFAVATEPVLFKVCVMPNVPAAAETVTVCDAVEPAAVALTVAVPLAAAPVTVITNLPCASVTPDVGDIVTCPPVPVTQDAVYATPGNPVPTAFFAIKVTVIGDVPSFGTLAPVNVNTESVEPEI